MFIFLINIAHVRHRNHVKMKKLIELQCSGRYVQKLSSFV